jgi:tetratricopeptide (TPR) repeat protein
MRETARVMTGWGPTGVALSVAFSRPAPPCPTEKVPMPSVVCPGCGRHIDLPEDELELPSITCARCDTAFCPADHRRWSEPDEPPPAGSPSRASSFWSSRRNGWLLLCLIAVLGIVVLGLPWLFVVSPRVAANQHLEKGNFYREQPGRANEQKAIAEYTEAIRLHPTAEAYRGRATCWLYLNNTTNAWGDYHEAMKLAPNDPANKELLDTINRWEKLLYGPITD